MKAGLTELGRRLPGKRLAALGFCFGGAMVWSLLASKDRRLAAAAPFYGPFPDGASLAGSKAAVLAIYGGLDDRVNGTRSAARAALKAAGVQHRLVTYPGADHAFFNDTGPRYDAAAAAAAEKRVLAWFGEHVDV
jgi:carboxymethylenebutenolidase